MSALTVTPISEIEQARLASCEEIITTGLETFVKVGRALAEIRDRKLYRARFGTFDAYCAARWGMSRKRAYDLLAAAEVTTTLSPVGDIPQPKTERVARELAPLRRDPDALREAWSEAVAEHGEEPTAKQVRSVVQHHREPAPAPKITRLTPRQRQIAQAHEKRMYSGVSPNEIAKVASIGDLQAMADEIHAGRTALDRLLALVRDEIERARGGAA
jgi:hypothetical protein